MGSIINSTRIDELFNPARRNAQELLPHLVRKLIFATIDIKSLRLCRIPAGDDISRPGYDGRVETIEGNVFVPAGFSVWEMSTGDPKSKAEDNYKKRTQNPGDINPAITSFVFVTPHKWENKDSWAQEKQKEGIWQKVVVLDNSDLETWLEITPAIVRWFARIIGIPVDSFSDTDIFLDESCILYGSIKIPDNLIIGGRTDTLTRLSNWINSASTEIVVQGESIEEAATFVAATIRKLPKEQSQQIASRTLFINEKSGIDFLATSRSQHFVVPLGNEVYKRVKALSLPNVRMIVPLTELQGKGGDDVIKLGPVQRRPCCEIINKMGYSSNKADRIASQSKGSLAKLLLLLGGLQGKTFSWMTGEAALELIPLMLAGQWSADNENDHNVIEKLSNKKYQEVEQIIAKWKTPEGQLIRRWLIWDWLALDFVWEHLSSQIDKAQVDRFIKTAMEILTIPDPRFELPPKDRWAASIYKKVHPYSASLRSGLIDSIVQLAIHNDTVLGGSGQAIADLLVRNLLTGKEGGFPINTWLSISSWIPDLAEASPRVFLDACDNLIKDQNAIGKIFEEGDMTFPTSEHTHLLWALERLAWSQEYLTRVTIILGKLSAEDPGGKLSNRPINSLREIFLPWHPYTTADIQHRLDAIDVLYSQNPEIAWKLACSLLPKGHDTSMPTAEPKWRNWKIEDSPKPTTPEYWAFIKELVERMVKWAGNRGDQWASLIKAYNELRKGYPELGGNLLSAINCLEPKNFSEPDKIILSGKIRKILTRHKQFPDAKWAMFKDDLKILETVYEKFCPVDKAMQYSWLFAAWPEIPIDSNVSYEEREKYIHTRRIEVIKEIYHTNGLKGLMRLAQNAGSPYAVGLCISEIDLSQSDEVSLLKDCLDVSIEVKENLPYLQAGLAFITGRYRRYGIKWAEDIILHDEIKWNNNKYVNLALGLPSDRQTWDFMKKWGEEVSNIYWKRVISTSISPYNESIEYAINQLISIGRFYAAFDLMCFSIRPKEEKEDRTVLPTELIIKMLMEAPEHDPNLEKDVSLDSIGYHVSEVLDMLENKGVDPTVIVQIEWIWMSALEYSSRGLKSLQKALSKDPNSFIHLLKMLYKGKNDEKHREHSEQNERMASNAFRLLSQWKIVPGLEELQSEKEIEGDIQFPKGKANEGKLFAWVKEARKLAKECDRIEVCDIQLGHVLAYSPSDQNGNWPCEPVRNLIEEMSSTDLEQGIITGVYNKRGVYCREKGGDQERELSAKFKQYAQQVSSKWPRTAAMLNHIAESYERDARREDERDAFEEFE
jgi:hypothetical protein